MHIKIFLIGFFSFFLCKKYVISFRVFCIKFSAIKYFEGFHNDYEKEQFFLFHLFNFTLFFLGAYLGAETGDRIFRNSSKWVF